MSFNRFLVSSLLSVVVLCSVAASADVVVTVNFSGSTSGSATFANAGDPEPIACSFANGTDTWDCATDTFIFFFNAVWVGQDILSIEPQIFNGGCTLDIFLGSYFTSGPCNEALDGGTYTLSSSSPTAGVFVVGRFSDNIVVFDDAGDFVQAVSLPTGFSSEARDIAQAPNGDIFVVRGEGAVHRYDSSLNFIGTWSSFNIAYGVNVDAAGLVYISGSGSSSVSVYNAAGGLQFTLTPSGGSNLRDTVKVGTDTWISNFTGGKIDIMNAGGTDIGDISTPTRPFGMQIAPNGDVWLVDQDSHLLSRITPAGTTTFSFDADDGPLGAIVGQVRYVGVATDGKVFIPRRDETRVDVYTDAGVHHSTLAHASLNGPDGIIARGTFGPQPEFTFDMIVASTVTIRSTGIGFVASNNDAGWIIATENTLTEDDLDALAFLTTTDDPQITPTETRIIDFNTELVSPLDPGDVAGFTNVNTTFQALLEPGEILVGPSIPFMQFGFNWPESFVGSVTATTVVTGNCVGSYVMDVDFIPGTSNPRITVDSAQRISVSCSAPPSAPILVPSGHIFSRILLVLILMLSPRLWWGTA